MAEEVLKSESKKWLKQLALFLVQKKFITAQQLEEILTFQTDIDLRIGQLATMKGYLSPKDALFIVTTQLNTQELFGQIAVREGLLKSEQVAELLALQDNSFHMFTQCLALSSALPFDELKKILAQFSKESNIPVLVTEENPQKRRSITRRFLKLKGTEGKVEDMKGRLKKLKDIAALPAVTQKVLATIESPDLDFRKLGQLIKMDVGLSAQMLRLINSTFFGLASKVSTLDRAIMTLGVNGVKKVVIMGSVMHNFKDVEAQEMQRIWSHSILTGQWAKTMGEVRGLREDDLEEIFLAGLLHDMGRLALLQYFKAERVEIRERVAMGYKEEDAEREVLGLSHPEIGAFLCHIWNFPEVLSLAILYHASSPATLRNLSFSPKVNLINASCRLSNLPKGEDGLAVDVSSLDAEFLSFHGLDPTWVMGKAQGVIKVAEDILASFR